MTDERDLRFTGAVCRAIFVFDLGREIDLAAARPLCAGASEGPDAVSRRSSVRVESAPLRCETAADPSVAARAGFAPSVRAGIYRFGALTLTYTAAAGASLAQLRAASVELTHDETLAAAARRDAERILARIAPAVLDPKLSPVSEEYFVFEMQRHEGAELDAFVRSHGRELAAVLRGETDELSEQEIAHAASTWVAHTPGDLAFLDWNAAIVFHPRPDEVREVLELANVQFLEMRFLDRALDASLQTAYEAVSRPTHWPQVFVPGALHEASRRIAQRQVDAAILHERVANVLKLVGDQYLARVYRGAAERFDLAAWNAANLQKLATLDGIYRKLEDRAATTRSEILEWLVILLILISFVVPAVR